MVYQIGTKKGAFDAHDVLSVLLEYHQESMILVAFIEKYLHEEGVDIDGRAYGNGVATVYFSS